MANTYKILGQSNPTPGVETNLYTVPVGTNAVISCITVCNFNNSASSLTVNSGKFTISVSAGGAATTNKDIIYYLVDIGQYNTYIANVGITLNAGDVIRIYTSVETLSFNLFGTEIT